MCLTLTATPIPRTLQLALSGVREMSLIATPPVDRLAVRTYVMPFDPMILREALLRERYRGGQTFYVVPRISDLDDAAAFLAEHVPELKVARAHGQMGSRELDEVMNAFYDRQYDVLLSTSIVESGLDIPSANTLIVHRADMFGLAQLYQLRGRVGRVQDPRLCLFHHSRRCAAYPRRREAPQGAAIARHAWRGLRAREPRSRHSGRRQSARRGAVGPYQRSGLSSFTSRCWKRRWRRSGAGTGDEVEDQWSPQHQSRHGGADPGGLCAGPAGAARALSAAVRRRDA